LKPPTQQGLFHDCTAGKAPRGARTRQRFESLGHSDIIKKKVERTTCKKLTIAVNNYNLPLAGRHFIMQPGSKRFVNLKDGRRLCYTTFGAQNPKRTVLYFHGYLSSRLEAALLDAEAQELGLQLLAFDRAGYGESTFDPNRTPQSSVSDAHELLEAVLSPNERVITMGASGRKFQRSAFAHSVQTLQYSKLVINVFPVA